MSKRFSNIIMFFNILLVSFSSQGGLLYPDRMEASECSLENLRQEQPFVLRGFRVEGGESLEMLTLGLDREAIHQIDPWMPYGSPKIFQNISTDTALGKEIQNFLTFSPTFALQIAVFFPRIWMREENHDPVYILLGRQSAGSEEVISDIWPVVDGAQTLNSIVCVAPEHKGALVEAMLALESTPLVREQWFHLAKLQRMGDGVPQDLVASARGLERLSAEGHAQASHLLVSIYNGDQGAEKNQEKVTHYFDRAVQQGYAPAQYDLGVIHEEAKNSLAALQCYRLAADQGFAPAQNKIGTLYEKGEGVGRNELTAVKYYQKAAAQRYAMATYNLGQAYDKGVSLKRDVKEAWRLYAQASDLGSSVASHRMAQKHENGWGGEPTDSEKALDYYKRGGDQGDPAQHFKVGSMYERRGNFEEALNYYKLAAAQQYPEADFKIGELYAAGRGVEKNDATAREHYAKSAALGYIFAQRILAPVEAAMEEPSQEEVTRRSCKGCVVQ